MCGCTLYDWDAKSKFKSGKKQILGFWGEKIKEKNAKI